MVTRDSDGLEIKVLEKKIKNKKIKVLCESARHKAPMWRFLIFFPPREKRLRQA